MNFNMESLKAAAKSLDKSVVDMSEDSEKDLKEGPDQFSHFLGGCVFSFTLGPSNVSNASEPIDLNSATLPEPNDFLKSLGDIEGLELIDRVVIEGSRSIEKRTFSWKGQFEGLVLESEYYPDSKRWWCSINPKEPYAYQEMFVLWRALRQKSKFVYVSEDMNEAYSPAFFYDFFLKGRLERKAKLVDPADRQIVEDTMRWFEKFLADSPSRNDKDLGHC